MPLTAPIIKPGYYVAVQHNGTRTLVLIKQVVQAHNEAFIFYTVENDNTIYSCLVDLAEPLTEDDCPF